MSSWKKWVLGIALILGAVSTALIAWLDADPETKPDADAVVEQVGEGIGVIRGEGCATSAPVAPVEGVE